MRRRSHRSHGRRFGRGGRTIYLESPREDIVTIDCVRDIDGICIPPDPGAGDIWPTFVTPDDARRYIDEVDSGYSRLDTSIQASTVAQEFKASWGIQLGTWKAFALSAKPTVGWLNTTAVMQQTDRFNAELKNWFSGFQSVGGKPPSPPPLPPGQGVPDPSAPNVGNITTLALVIGGVAALVIFGPKLARFI